MINIVFCACFCFVVAFCDVVFVFLLRFFENVPPFWEFLIKSVLFCRFFFVLCGYAVIFALVFELAKS